MRARVALGAVGALSLLLATGCATGDSGSGDGVVELLVAGDPEELRAYRELAAAFEASQDDIDVDIVEAADSGDLQVKLGTALSAGAPPDVFLMNYRNFGQYAARGALQPLDELVDGSDVLDKDDLYPQAVDAFRYDGDLQCLPQNASSLVTYYNADLFAAAGLEAPAAGWTWDEMVALATKLTGDSDGDGAVDQYGLGIEPELVRVAPFVWANGGDVVDDPDDPSQLALDTPAALEPLQDFLDLFATDHVIPSDPEIESEDVETRFANGRLAMLFSSRRATPTFRTITDFTWDVAPLPVGDEPVSILHADGYCIVRTAPDADAAWRFVEFAISPAGAKVIAGTGRTVPSLRSVAESPAFLDPDAPPKHAQVWLDNIPHVRSVPNVSTWPEIEDAAAGILERALYAGDDAEAVAAELDEVTRPMFARDRG